MIPIPQKKELDVIAARIFQLVDEKYKEQKDFATAIEETPSIVSQWRNGISKSYRRRISKIAEVLGTTTDYLLSGENPSGRDASADIPEFVRLQSAGRGHPDFIFKFNQLTHEGQDEIIALIEIKLSHQKPPEQS